MSFIVKASKISKLLDQLFCIFHEPFKSLSAVIFLGLQESKDSFFFVCYFCVDGYFILGLAM